MTPRPPSLVGRGAVLALAIAWLCGWSSLRAAAPAVDYDTMIVPGGTEAIARLLGNVDTDPQRFAISLNRVLLRTVRPDHDWQRIEERVALNEFLVTVAKLEQRLSFPLVLEGTSEEAARQLGVLVDVLGFVLESADPPFHVEAREDAAAIGLQRCSQALGWNVAALAHRLNAGDTVVVRLSHGVVPLAIDTASWNAMTAAPVTASGALLQMARDQRLGLVAEGRRRMTRETRESLSRDDLSWLYANAPAAFYRYSFAIELREGRLRLPGGPETAAAWKAWVGADPSNWRSFVRALLAEQDPEHAHVWAALYPVPDPVARYYVDNFVAEPWARTRLAPILEAMASVYGPRFFTGAREPGPGFQTAYRAVVLDGSDADPYFPHGPGLWLQSLQGDDVPKDRAALAKSVSKAMRSRIDAAQCIAQCMTSANLASKEWFPIQRYLLTGHVLGGLPDLTTAENVFLVNRMAARYPGALRDLQRMGLNRPETVRAYLMTVSSFQPEQNVADQVARFQGGIELVVELSEVGKADARVLESALSDWLAQFPAGTRRDELPERIAVWLGGLLERLPQPPKDSPGRGPLERAWLDALAPGRDPQVFEWDGLAYEARRARDRAASMLALLERENLSPVDEVLQSLAEFAELSTALTDLDLDRCHEIATRLLETSRSTPASGERAQLLLDVVAARHVRELPGLDRRLDALLRSEAEQLEQQLMAPPYLASLSELDSPLFQDQRLIRRHEVVDSTIQYPNPWSGARIIRDTGSRGGPYLVGRPGDVPSALTELVVQSLNPGPGAVQVAVFPRQNAWLLDAAGPSWSRVAPEAVQLAAALVDVGDSILEQAAVEIRTGAHGPAQDFAARRVPRYRLEDGSSEVRVTPSERLSLGLAAIRGDLHGGPAPELVGETRRATVRDVLRSGSDSWGSLDALGARTPHLNGRFRRWIGGWLPYETLDRDASTDALVERELVDLRLAIALFLARHRLPPEVGSDLQHYAVARARAELHLESAEDWESVVAWVNRLDDAYLKDGMRRCLEEGLYRVAGS